MPTKTPTIVIRTRLIQGQAGPVLCVTNNVVVNRIIATLEYAATLGYDLVGEGSRAVHPTNPTIEGWLIGGTFYPDAPRPIEDQTSDDMERKARQAMAQMRQYIGIASPTAAQTAAIAKVLCKVCIILIRRWLGQFDASD